MLALVFVVCLQGDPDVCRERNLLFTADQLTPMTCMMQAQHRLAEWSNNNPRWQIGRWRCGMVRDGKTI